MKKEPIPQPLDGAETESIELGKVQRLSPETK